MILRIRRFLKKDYAGIILGGSLFAMALLIDAFISGIPALIAYILAMLGAGYSVFISAIRGILRRDFLDEKFLMVIASVGAMIIGERAEGVAVMLFFLVGEFFEHRAVRSSRTSIKELMNIRPDTARVLAEGKEQTIDAEDVTVGDIVVIRPGERVPCDCTVVLGEAELDTSMLTGEAVPRGVRVGDEIDSGVIVLGAAIQCRAIRTAQMSAASRVLELVENAAENKSREEAFITKFSRVYTPAVIILAMLMAVVPPIFSLLKWTEAVYRALSFLVVSCPCALVISVPMSFFGGIGGAASAGVLYKGANTFSPVSKVENIVFDKTGTLTTGEFTLSGVDCIGIDREELLLLAASAEYNSNHPLARCIKEASSEHLPVSHTEEIVGRGVIAEIQGQSIAVGNASLMEYIGVNVGGMELGGRIFVAKNGALCGILTVTDTVKEEAAAAVSELRELGVKRFYILSGDRRESVERVAGHIGADKAFWELLPEDKYRVLEDIILRSEGGTMYVGDGINDAPALARADVGVAMGRLGQDSAIEAADAVIMSDKLSKLPEAVRIARKTLRIAKQNIIFSISVKLLVLILVAVSLAGMWLAVFADVGVAVIAILNAMRALRTPKRIHKKYRRR